MMKVIAFLLITIVQYAVCQEKFAISFLSAQLDQYCKVRNGDLIGDASGETKGQIGRAGPRGPPGFVNYTLIEEMIEKTASAKINSALASETGNSKLIARNGKRADDNWLELQQLKITVDQLIARPLIATTAAPTTKTITRKKCTGLKTGGKCYVVIVENTNSIDAVSKCQNIGGEMANIYSSCHYNDIMDYIPKHLTSNQYEIVLGMTYSASDSRVLLSTGEVAPFITWLPGWPTISKNKTQVALRVNENISAAYEGMWNDLPTYIYHGVLCEI